MRKPEGEEARTRKVQLMQKQSLVDRARERAEDEGISLNEWINRAVQEYLHYGADNSVERKTRRVQILLTPTTYDDLTALADKYNRSINDTIEHAIQAGLSGPDYFERVKYLNKKVSDISSTLSGQFGGFGVTWNIAWKKIRNLQKEMSSPKMKKAEKEEIQAKIDAEADALWKAICQIETDVKRVINGENSDT